MDPTALYYALSTIAQCAAALAALIGFLGLWRLDRLREESVTVEQALRAVLRAIGINAPLTREAVVTTARDRVERWRSSGQRQGNVQAEEQLEPLLARWRAIPGDQERVMGVLQRFLRRTLVILAFAIIGLVFADALNAWVVTALVARLFSIFAGYRLWRDTASVVREAARSIRSLVIIAVLLALASPALAGPVRCTTSEEKTLGRLQTLCADGTRAVSTWSPTLQRWDTTITASPRQTCTGQMNPRTRQWEGRCRWLRRTSIPGYRWAFRS
jgi:hypothetical protein